MKILTDNEIVKCVDVKDPNCIIKGVKEQLDWFSRSSPVQPTSIDLTIGSIFIPKLVRKKKKDAPKSYENLILKQGHTAVILTKEILDFPSNIAGIGFPPSRLAIQGLLMTNPGHVDPGSKGPLHFAVINMGKEDISLRKGDRIFSLILIMLHENVHKNLKDRSGGNVDSLYSVSEQLEKLSYDFLNIEERATAIARKEVKREGVKALILPPIIAAIIVALGSWFSLYTPFQQKINKIEKDLSVISQQIDNKDIQTKVGEIEKEIENLKSKILE